MAKDQGGWYHGEETMKEYEQYLEKEINKLTIEVQK